jgi:putative endonuclease
MAGVDAMPGGWVYNMTNRSNGTLYVGTTTSLARRVWEHREGVADGFTKRYGLKRLVYAERDDDILLAKQREINIKHWSRAWKGPPHPQRKSELGRSLRQDHLSPSVAWMAGPSPAKGCCWL